MHFILPGSFFQSKWCWPFCIMVQLFTILSLWCHNLQIKESLRNCSSVYVNWKWPRTSLACKCRQVATHSYEIYSKFCTMIFITSSFFQSNQISLPQFVGNHWCYELIYQTCSYISAHIVHWITSNTQSKWAMFSLSERTAHRASHYTLVGGISKILVL